MTNDDILLWLQNDIAAIDLTGKAKNIDEVKRLAKRYEDIVTSQGASSYVRDLMKQTSDVAAMTVYRDYVSRDPAARDKWLEDLGVQMSDLEKNGGKNIANQNFGSTWNDLTLFQMWFSSQPLDDRIKFIKEFDPNKNGYMSKQLLDIMLQQSKEVKVK